MKQERGGERGFGGGALEGKGTLSEASSYLWLVEETNSSRFPYRLKILQGDQVLLDLLTQDLWPPEGKQLFCLRPGRTREPILSLGIKEKFPIKALKRTGPLLYVVIDRRVRKRCEFLFTKKRYKNQPGEYEQIFWRSESLFRQKVARLKRRLDLEVTILVDIRERYPYQFPKTSRVTLPVGDYAVEREGRIVGVVERKTFADFLRSIQAFNRLCMVFAELATFPHAAVVVEAPYHYFLEGKRVAPFRLKPSKVEQAIHELLVKFPGVHLVFLENRKVAQLWCGAFLRAAVSQMDLSQPDIFETPKVAEESSLTYTDPESFMAVLGTFTFRQLKENFPDWPENKLRKLLEELKAQGRVVCEGRGPKARWHYW